MNNRLSVQIGEVTLKNPLLTASGTFGFAREYSELFDVSLLGGIVVKGLTLQPKEGNPPPRIAETPSGLLNAIGLQNPGVRRFVAEELPALRRIGTAVIANIAGSTLEEFAEIAKILEAETGITALELNISCPNVRQGGMAFGVHPESAAKVTEVVKKHTTLPVWVKLSPNVTDITEIAKAVEEAGADAITLINTLLGMAIDLEKRRPVLGNIFGGLSGPAVKPVALRMVWQVYEAVKIPIIGMGGIISARDVLEFIMAGASAVAIGTGLFAQPLAPVGILRELEEFLIKEDVAQITELTGVAHNFSTR
ncbi:MAG TPA: dihydroorotate dehydrogenase [Bacillota bacterium]